MALADNQLTTAVAYRPRIGRALKNGLQVAYDNMGVMLVGSTLWIGAAALLAAGGTGLFGLAFAGREPGRTLLALLCGLVAAGIGTGPITAALFRHARRLQAHDDPYWWELLSSVGREWQRGLSLAALQVTVSVVLLMDALFFFGQERFGWRLVGLLFLYPLLFWLGAMLLQWPLAVERDGPVREVVKKSLLLLLDNLGFVVVMALALAGFTLLCRFTLIGLVLAWAGTAAMIGTAAVRELLPKYERLPVDTPAAVVDG